MSGIHTGYILKPKYMLKSYKDSDTEAYLYREV